MCVCVNARMCVYVYVRVCVLACVYDMSVRVCVCACESVRICVFMCLCVSVCICVWVCMFVVTNMNNLFEVGERKVLKHEKHFPLSNLFFEVYISCFKVFGYNILSK
jgi:hypothetical protein